ncbi:MAG: hypothetical protein J6B01_12085 [Ruminococcus sp.]|nr:hypothetical protein [Ruminococcus sp.]
MFCLKCGKSLRNAGICPFCQHDNSERSANNYLKSDEMLGLYKDDPDFEIMFGGTAAEEKPPKSDLVFSSNKPHGQPDAGDADSLPKNNSEFQRSTPAARPAIPREQPDRRPDGYVQQRSVRPVDAARENPGDGGSVRINSANEAIGASPANTLAKKKFSFAPVVIILILAIIGEVIIFAVKMFGKSDDGQNDRDDKPGSVIQDETRPEEETMPTVDDGSVVDENSNGQNDIPGSEEPTEDVPVTEEPTSETTEMTTEETTDTAQSGLQDEWKNKAYDLEEDITDKIKPLMEHNPEEIEEECNHIQTASRCFTDYSFLKETGENDNLDYFNDILNGNRQYSDEDNNRICSRFDNLNMYYFKNTETGDYTTQYLVTRDEPGQGTQVGMMCIYRDSPKSKLAYMALSFDSNTEFFVIVVDENTDENYYNNSRVFDMQTVLAQFQTQDNNFTNGVG